MLKFKKDDNVKITSGKDNGRDGKIERVFTKEEKVIIPGINMYKKHMKGTQGQKGGIYDIPKPISFAKIALICPKCKKVTRVGFKVEAKEKLRICRKCGKEMDTK